MMTATSAPAGWLSRKQAQAHTGLSGTTIWRLVARGALKPARVGSRLLFRVDDLNALLERAQRKAVEI